MLSPSEELCRVMDLRVRSNPCGCNILGGTGLGGESLERSWVCCGRGIMILGKWLGGVGLSISMSPGSGDVVDEFCLIPDNWFIFWVA